MLDALAVGPPHPATGAIEGEKPKNTIELFILVISKMNSSNANALNFKVEFVF